MVSVRFNVMLLTIMTDIRYKQWIYVTWHGMMSTVIGNENVWHVMAWCQQLYAMNISDTLWHDVNSYKQWICVACHGMMSTVLVNEIVWHVMMSTVLGNEYMWHVMAYMAQTEKYHSLPSV